MTSLSPGLITETKESCAPARPRAHTVGVLSILTTAVAICGYLREATLASRFGVSATMDAYFGATFIPTLVYMVLIAGTFSPVFISILAQQGAIDNSAKLSETFSVVTTFSLVLLGALVFGGMATASKWMPLLFVGYSPETIKTSLQLIQIIFPATLFVAAAGILTAVLNTFHRFSLAASAPALSSIAVIAAALSSRGPKAIFIVALGTAVGFVLQFLLLVPATASLGVRFVPTFRLRHPAVRILMRLGGPLFLYLVVGNALLFLERNLASRVSAGAVSTLNYATRLFAVPSNFLVGPLATVAYPLFATEAVREGRGNLRSQVLRLLRLVIFLFLPLTAWTILNALPITRLLYERGQFGLQDSVITSRVLMLYSIGILPFAIGVILLRCFYAVQDTVTPLVAELIGLGFYAFAATSLTARFGLAGLAASRGCAFYVVSAILIVVLSKKLGLLRVGADFLLFFLRTSAATAAMGVISWTTLHLLQPAFDSAHTIVRGLTMFVILFGSAVFFLAVARLLGVSEAAKVVRTGVALLGSAVSRERAAQA